MGEVGGVTLPNFGKKFKIWAKVDSWSIKLQTNLVS